MPDTGTHERTKQAAASRLASGPATLSSTWPTELFLLGGNDRAELRHRIGRLQAILAENPTLAPSDLGFSLSRSLKPGGVRLAVIAPGLGELKTKLQVAAQALEQESCTRLRDPSGLYFEASPLLASGGVAVLFPGEGAQYPGMLADLLPHFPEVRESVEVFDREIGVEDHEQRVSQFFAPVEGLESAERTRLNECLRQIDWAMASVLAADGALGHMVSALGLAPDAVAGHSAGELAALVAAGAIDRASEMQPLIAALRGQGDEERRSSRAEAILLATAASREALDALIEELAPTAPGEMPSVYVAMDNCPHQTVVVGRVESMERIEAALKSKRVVFERLPFSRPYHTPLFEPFMGPWREAFSRVKFEAPVKPLYSCTTAELFPREPEQVRDLALSHWASPVRFRRLIERLADEGIRVFVEAGPRGNLSAFVQDILRGRDCLAIPADLPRRSALTQWNHLVGQLAVHQAEIDVTFLYRHRKVHAVDLGALFAPSSAAEPATTALPATWPPAPTSPAMKTSIAQSTPSVAQPVGMAIPTDSATGPALVMARHLSLMESFVTDQQMALRQFFQSKSQGVNLQKASRSSRPAVRSTNVAPLGRPAALPSARADGRTGLSAPGSGGANAPGVALRKTNASMPARTNERLPLQGVVVRQTQGEELVIHRRLDLAEDRYADEHTVGGREISRVNPDQHGLPVMPMTFILELMAEAAVRLVPGHVVIAVTDVQLQKWLAFDEQSPSTVEMVARRLPKATDPRTIEVQVSVRDLGRASDTNRAVQSAVSSATLVLSQSYPPSPKITKLPEKESRPTKVGLRTLYHNLFHGPMFQGVRDLQRIGGNRLTATIEVLPRDGLFASLRDPQFLIDPVTVDVGMHPSAAWHLEQPDQAGRILLPFELKRIEFFSPSPPVATMLRVYTEVTHASPRVFTHSGEIAFEDERVWCRLSGVKCWRFYLPLCDVNFNGPKDEYFVSNPVEVGVPANTNSNSAVCVRFDPRGDISQAGMLDAAARVTLSDREMRVYRELRLPAESKAAWLFRRIAVKDATRLLLRKSGGARHFIADLDVDHDSYGRTTIAERGGNRPIDFPTVAVAEGPGQILALAVRGPWAGLAIESVARHAEEKPGDVMSDDEWEALSALGGDPSQRVARLVAARTALQGALGPDLIPRVELLRVRGVNSVTGELEMELPQDLCPVFPDVAGGPIRVRTTIDDGYVVASTAGPAPGARP